MTVAECAVACAPAGMRGVVEADRDGAFHYCGTMCIRRGGVWYLRTAGPEKNVKITVCPGCGLELATAEVVSQCAQAALSDG